MVPNLGYERNGIIELKIQGFNLATYPRTSFISLSLYIFGPFAMHGLLVSFLLRLRETRQNNTLTYNTAAAHIDM